MWGQERGGTTVGAEPRKRQSPERGGAKKEGGSQKEGGPRKRADLWCKFLYKFRINGLLL